MELVSGQVLVQRYEIKGLIGQGGMGTVYLAHDPVLDRDVAIKQLALDALTSDQAPEQMRQQFLREAQALANLNHPNLPRVTDFFECDGLHYLVMDYIAGTSLQEVLHQPDQNLDEDQVLNWADQLLAALEYIHKRNLIHRDIKPANIRLTADGHVFLVDFGLVKHYDVSNPKTLTLIHTLGTLEYAPPEQYDSTGHTDQRSDLYALGATLYHLLAGHAPVSVSRRIAEPGAFQPLQTYNAKISPEISQVIGRAMEMERDKRFASAADMRAALRYARQRNAASLAGTINLAEQAPATVPGVTAPHPQRRSTRRMIVVGVLAIAALALIVAAFASRPGGTGSNNVRNSTGGSPADTPAVLPVLAATLILSPTSFTPTFTPTLTPTLTPTRTLVILSVTPLPGTATVGPRPTSGKQPQPTVQATRQPPGQTNRPTPKPTKDNSGGGSGGGSKKTPGGGTGKK